jgi:hypothetical protein
MKHWDGYNKNILLEADEDADYIIIMMSADGVWYRICQAHTLAVTMRLLLWVLEKENTMRRMCDTCEKPHICVYFSS